ncbi:MAG: DUF5915 domain-containing protein, partial [Acidimicrobiales bacterium]
GIARDVVRVVQQARRENGFQVTDRISLTVHCGAAVIAAIEKWQDYVTEQTLATELKLVREELSEGIRLPGGDYARVEISRFS